MAAVVNAQDDESRAGSGSDIVEHVREEYAVELTLVVGVGGERTGGRARSTTLGIARDVGRGNKAGVTMSATCDDDTGAEHRRGGSAQTLQHPTRRCGGSGDGGGRKGRGG
jgi:hypothetical protein